MTTRKGLGRGMGCGYKNMIPKDPMVHRMAAKGMKQPQQVPEFIKRNKLKIAKNTYVLTPSEFLRFVKSKSVYSVDDFNTIYEDKAVNRNGTPVTFLYRDRFVPKNIKFKKKYYDDHRRQGGWKVGAQAFETETTDGKSFYDLKDVWKATYSEKTKKYYVTRMR